MDAATVNSIFEQLQECPWICDVNIIDVKRSVVEDRGGVVAFQGQVHIDGQCATMQVGLDDSFPLSLPLVYLVPWDAFGFLPHVDKTGYVCYAQKEGLLLNRREPSKIVEEAVERSISVLQSGIRGENHWDFVDEFESYWRNLDQTRSMAFFVEPTRHVKKILTAKVANQTETYAFVCDDIEVIQTHPKWNEWKSLPHRNALCVPLAGGALIKPPQPGTFWTAEYVREIVYSNLTPENYSRLQKLGKKSKWEELVIFQLPRPSGGSAFFGILYVAVEQRHPLIQGGHALRMVPITLDRYDREYLLPRGGASVDLQERRVAIVGCGSVGSFIAFELIKAGILDLTLVDHDLLLPENTFRHLLGKDVWGMPKAVALKAEIERKLPYIRVHAIAERVERALATGMFDPENYDLLLVALGDDTVSLYLNELLHSTSHTPLTVFTWLEPYGIGGHALLVGNTDGKGCLECLFTPTADVVGHSFVNRASFAASGQSFSKDLSGCGSRFTPYGSTHALQTALLASQLATQALLGEISGNPILSWKGDDREFVRAGFTVSSRYMLSEKDLRSRCYDYYNPNCPVCGKGA